MAIRPLCAAASVLALTVPARADIELTRAGGLIGAPIVYTLQGDPFEIYVWIPSLVGNSNIPLAIFDGLDPRFLSIGFDLLVLQSIGFLDAAGSAQVALFIPGDPTLSGAQFHAQALTWPGSPTTFDDLSNLTSTRLAAHGLTHYAFSENAVARQGHTLTLLADGTALVAGGDQPDTQMPPDLTPLDSLELYHPQAMTFELLAGAMTLERSTHTATRLADGRVLLAGGYDASEVVNGTAEIWDPATRTSQAVASMSNSRTQHSATLLGDGRVFVAGGSDLFDLDQPVQSILGAHRTTERFDPSTGSWTAGPLLPKARVGHTAVLLPNGRVLLAGGVEITVIIPNILEIPGVAASCLLYDPATNSFSNTGAMSEARVFHGALLLSSGKVAAVGGADVDFTAVPDPDVTILGTTELYDPATGLWSAAGALQSPRAYPNLVETQGALYVIGGLSSVEITGGTGIPEKDIESAAPTLASWTIAGSMAVAEHREVGRAIAIESGARILTVGAGRDHPTAPTVIKKTAEVFVP